MQAELFDALRGILLSELPQSGSSGRVVILDHVVEGWYYGNQTVIADVPAILLESQSATPKPVAFGTYEVEHSVNLSLFVRGGDTDDAERLAQEMCRIVWEALLPHRQVWVCSICPLCRKTILTPQHYTEPDGSGGHETLLAPFVTAVEADYASLWTSIHGESSSVPALTPSGVAAEAFNRLYDLLGDDADAVVMGLTTAQRANLLAFRRDRVRPIRLVYDLYPSEIKPIGGEVGDKEEKLLKGSGFTLRCKEVVLAGDSPNAFGPDGVPTTAW